MERNAQYPKKQQKNQTTLQGPGAAERGNRRGCAPVVSPREVPGKALGEIKQHPPSERPQDPGGAEEMGAYRPTGGAYIKLSHFSHQTTEKTTKTPNVNAAILTDDVVNCNCCFSKQKTPKQLTRQKTIADFSLLPQLTKEAVEKEKK